MTLARIVEDSSVKKSINRGSHNVEATLVVHVLLVFD